MGEGEGGVDEGALDVNVGGEKNAGREGSAGGEGSVGEKEA